MKIVNWIESWTRRNLKWILPFCIVMPPFLWWWNHNLDAIGYWLWLALHGQKTMELEIGLAAVLAGALSACVLYMLVITRRK